MFASGRFPVDFKDPLNIIALIYGYSLHGLPEVVTNGLRRGKSEGEMEREREREGEREREKAVV